MAFFIPNKAIQKNLPSKLEDDSADNPLLPLIKDKNIKEYYFEFDKELNGIEFYTGKITYTNQDEYIGSFFLKKGKVIKEGLGIMNYRNANVYKGLYVNNVETGTGIMLIKTKKTLNINPFTIHEKNNYTGNEILNINKIYHGEFKKGKVNGDGTIIEVKKNTMTLNELIDIINSLMENTDIIPLPECRIYQGPIKNNEPHGEGQLLIFTKDEEESEEDQQYKFSIYKGNMKHGSIYGKGEYISENNIRYNGQFNIFTPHGEGTIKFTDRSTYNGLIKDCYAHGKGTMCFKNIGTYEGEFKKGKLHGYGEMKYRDGITVTGYYKRGIRYNKKKMTTIKYPNGNEHIGRYKNGKRYKIWNIKLDKWKFNVFYKDDGKTCNPVTSEDTLIYQKILQKITTENKDLLIKELQDNEIKDSDEKVGDFIIFID
jgi:hypothetical protein